jgi:predicted  nucleic acid-binding Zn-ribbon protein
LLPFFQAFEENLQKCSASDLSKFNSVLSLETTLASKIISERFNENEELVAKLSDESQDLKHNLDKIQASNLELEKQIVELKESLKKSSEEKRLADIALHDLKKEQDKLAKTREDDLKMIQNLGQDAYKSTNTINELRGTNAELATKNTDLVKPLSMKEQTIFNLEKALYEQNESLSKDAVGIRQSFKLLFEEYKEALSQFGTRPNPSPEKDDVSEIMD